MKAKDLKVKITIRSIILFEELTGKSFNALTQEDFYMLLYCIITTDNPELRLTLSDFNQILKSKDLGRRMMDELKQEMEYIESTTPKDKASAVEEEDSAQVDSEPVKISEVALSLVINYGLDIEYVMDKMKLWEIAPLARAAEEKVKQDMVDKRFWSYLNILPHIDGKKAGGPEKFLPFPWETQEKKNKDKEFIKNNEQNIMSFFQQQNNKENAGRNEDPLKYGGLCQDNGQPGQAGEDREE